MGIQILLSLWAILYYPTSMLACGLVVYDMQDKLSRLFSSLVRMLLFRNGCRKCLFNLLSHQLELRCLFDKLDCVMVHANIVETNITTLILILPNGLGLVILYTMKYEIQSVYRAALQRLHRTQIIWVCPDNWDFSAFHNILLSRYLRLSVDREAGLAQGIL